MILLFHTWSAETDYNIMVQYIFALFSIYVLLGLKKKKAAVWDCDCIDLFIIFQYSGFVFKILSDFEQV